MPRKPNVRLSEACELYLQRCTQQGQATATVTHSRHALMRFRDAVKGDPFLHIISPSLMDTYCFGPRGIRQSVRYGRPMSAAGFNRYLAVLRQLFAYATLMRWTDVNPTAHIATAKAEPPSSKLWLNAGELLALLDHCVNPIERVACSLGMNTGLRSNDLKRLTIFDVSLAGGTIQTYIRKTGKFDVKPVTMDLSGELSRWLDTYARMMGLESRGELPGEWLLIPSYSVRPTYDASGRVDNTAAMALRPMAMHTSPYRLVQRPLRRMGYPTRQEGFHTLRRSSARVFFESLRSVGDGRDHALMVVQEFLNHSSTIQTQRYLGLNQERAIRDAWLKDKPFLSSVREVEQERVNGGSQKVEQLPHGAKDRHAV